MPTATRPLQVLAPRLPRLDLGVRPTPLRSASLLGCTVVIKDDGECCPLYSGNKARKLEFLLADALAAGASEVRTIGAAGSNHVVATAVHARAIGLRCSALHFHQPPTRHVCRNVAAAVSQDCRLRIFPLAAVPAALAAAAARDRLSRQRRRYFIAGGGSSAVGMLGYVDAGLELAAQLDAARLHGVRRVYVAAGTCGTFAGLAAGLALAGRADIEVIGVRVTDAIVCSDTIARRLIAGSAELLAPHGVSLAPQLPRWQLRHDQFPPGYGVPTASAIRAVELAQSELSLSLETTYTGRALAALVDDIESCAVRDGEALFYNTLNQRDVARWIRPGFGSSDLPRGYSAYAFDDYFA